MKRLTDTQIQEINKIDRYDSDQGIYTTPFGLEKIEGKIIYQRHHVAGHSGGGYWDGANARYYKTDEPRPAWRVLDEVLKIICPDISYLRYREIESLVQVDNYDDDSDYYGNNSEYDIYYIPLETLYKHLGI